MERLGIGRSGMFGARFDNRITRTKFHRWDELGRGVAPRHIYEPAVKGHDGYEPRDIAQLVRLVASGRLDLSRSVSHVVPLEDVVRGVERLRTKDGNPIRIVVKP